MNFRQTLRCLSFRDVLALPFAFTGLLFVWIANWIMKDEDLKDIIKGGTNEL